MIQKEKAWYWKLTGPFASDNYTTIGNTLYYPKDSPPTPEIVAHEEIHVKQQEAEGVLKFMALYLLALPLFYNPWRFKWEYEAYTQGSKWSDTQTRAELKTAAYGWLRNR